MQSRMLNYLPKIILGNLLFLCLILFPTYSSAATTCETSPDVILMTENIKTNVHEFTSNQVCNLVIAAEHQHVCPPSTNSNGNLGSINLTVQGGTLPYSYSWNYGATTQNISGLDAGAYSVTVTDINGCTAKHYFQIESATPMTLSGDHQHVCPPSTNSNGSPGSVDLKVQGGQWPYTYSWDNGKTTQDIYNLTPNDYRVTVTDKFGCTAKHYFKIEGATSMTLTGDHQHVCPPSTNSNGSPGSIDLKVQGGQWPYTYSWDNGKTTQDIYNLAPDDYRVTVTDKFGCTAKHYFRIEGATSMTLTGAHQHVCPPSTNSNGSPGSIDLKVQGGQWPYTYSWDNGKTTQDIYNLTPDDYKVTVTDKFGCTAKHYFKIEKNSEKSIINDLTIFPNPVTDVLNITILDSGINYQTARIINSTGKVVQFEHILGLLELQVDVSAFPNGIYFIEMTDGDANRVVEKFMKLK